MLPCSSEMLFSAFQLCLTLWEDFGGFPWHRYWSGFPFPSPGPFTDEQIEANKVK